MFPLAPTLRTVAGPLQHIAPKVKPPLLAWLMLSATESLFGTL
jgi:hypothetical protein